ncbi:MAG: AraC family transcriptional regulator, partial [Bacilli bacterium]|nr:AraC family transcriptional regulator [Bacilli bacterium]
MAQKMSNFLFSLMLKYSEISVFNIRGILMKLIEFVNLTSKPFILNYRDTRTTGEEWDNFHSHQGMEFLFIHEGSGHIVLEQKIHPVSNGTLIFFQPFQLHRVRMNTNSTRYVRTVLNLDPVYLDSYLQAFPKFRGYFHCIWKEKLTRQIFKQENRSPEINSLFERFHIRISQSSSEFHNEEFVLFMISILQYLRSTSMDMTAKE